MRNIITWFQKQRAYRANVHTIDLGRKKDKDIGDVVDDDDQSRSSSEDLNGYKL